MPMPSGFSRVSWHETHETHGPLDIVTAGDFFPGRGVLDSWTPKPSMPIPSAFTPSNTRGRFWTPPEVHVFLHIESKILRLTGLRCRCHRHRSGLAAL